MILRQLRKLSGLSLHRSSTSLLAAAILCGGCTSSKPPEFFGGMPGGTAAPETPLFLRGPAALLLTNTSGFTARVMMEVRPFPGEVQTVSGDLFGRGQKLFFTPDSKAVKSKLTRSAGISFSWDVAQARGCVLSDALQGCAPVSGTLQLTNFLAQPSPNADSPERIEGHSCKAETISAAASDGSTMTLRVWRAMDLQGLPLRIVSAGGSPTFTFNLSKVRLEAPPDDLFLPPDSFTKYTSAEAMMNELSMRQHNLRARPSQELPAADFATPQQSRRPGAY
jgi:hypothetical protein